MRPNAIILVGLGGLAAAALAIGIHFTLASTKAGFFAASVLMGVAGLAFMVALVLATVSVVAVRGGLVGQIAAAIVSGVALLRLGPYFVGTITREEAWSWVAVVAVPTALLAAVFLAASWGLVGSLRRSRS